MITAERADYPSRAFVIRGDRTGRGRSFHDLCAAGDAAPIREDVWRRIESCGSDRGAITEILNASSSRAVSGIVSFDDADTRRTVALAELMSVVDPVFAASALAVLDKSHVYSRLRSAGLEVPDFAVGRTWEELELILRESKVPLCDLVIKPSVGTGSIGVYRPRPHDTSRSIADRLTSYMTAESPAALVMPYLDGAVGGVREFSADGVLLDGQVLTVALCEKTSQHALVAYQDRMIVCPPLTSALSERLDEVAGIIVAALAALQCDANVFHIEFRVSDKGALVPIDIALRPGGGFVAEAVAATTGVDLRTCHVAAAQGDRAGLQALVERARRSSVAMAIGAFYSAPSSRPDPKMLCEMLASLRERSDVAAFHCASELTDLPSAQPDVALSLAVLADQPDMALERLSRLANELGLE